jgi:hypothetical protein
MKRKSFVLAVLAAAVSAASVAAVSFAAGGGTSRKSITLHLIEKDQGFHYVDNPPVSTPQEQQSSQGDEFVFAANLFTTAGKRAGSLDAYCVVTRGGSRDSTVCSGTFALAGGQLQGMVAQRGDSNVIRIAIVGGTGAYEGAKGSIVSVTKDDSNISRDTVHILLS